MVGDGSGGGFGEGDWHKVCVLADKPISVCWNSINFRKKIMFGLFSHKKINETEREWERERERERQI